MKDLAESFRFVRAFLRDQRANVTIEAAILIPIMVWGYLAMFTFFDAFRQHTTQQKAAYTVSDLISRQFSALDAGFIDGSYMLFQALSRIQEDPGLRVTVATYDNVNSEYAVVWSRTRGVMTPLQSSDIALWSDRLPELPLGEQIIIVETTAGYQPVFNIGLNHREINNFVFTRPRYRKQVCFDDICDLPKPVVPEAGPEESA